MSKYENQINNNVNEFSKKEFKKIVFYYLEQNGVEITDIVDKNINFLYNKFKKEYQTKTVQEAIQMILKVNGS